MDKDDIFATLDDKTIITPMPSKASNFAKPRPGTRPTETPMAADPYLAGNAIDTINAIREAGINSVVACAAPLLSSLHRLRTTLRMDDINAFRRRIVSEIQQFERSAEQKLVSKQNVLVARYILCAALDEAVLNTPWGSSGTWAQQTLLNFFHKEASGGEKFFIIIDRLLPDAAANIELIELAAVCLGLGYKGKFRIDPMGDSKIENLRNNLLARIQTVRGPLEQSLSPNWAGENAPDRNMQRRVPMWLVGAITAALLITVYSGFKFSLNSLATPVLSDLERIGKPSIEQERGK
ncbi:MAG: type IVB secretion system protein IcmH/DotU [Gammaproteobacteria bacterium]|nr:type IVB secretion system protein IcmH/DotU [Gammaproteobacteria bacterium]